MGKADPILKETFQIGNSPHSVLLFQHQLTWCPKKRGTEDMSEWMKVRIHDILAVELHCKNNNVVGEESPSDCANTSPINSPSCCLPNDKDSKRKGKKGKKSDISSSFSSSLSSNSSSSTSSSNKGGSAGQRLTIHFGQRDRDSGKWIRSSIHLSHKDFPTLSSWHGSLQGVLNGMTNRPRNLLFFVNPYGGKHKGVQIFEQKVKPLLNLCSCKFTVVNTQRRNHVTEAIAGMSLEKIEEYDVVVGVGGDGTICEIVTGLLTRGFSSNQTIDEGDLQPAPVPVAVIPAGSSNALAFTLHGTDDPTTAILHVLLGNAAPLDVAAIHNHSGISRFIVGQMSYGHLADTMLYSEKLRWMGPKRYDIAGFRKFLAHSFYEGSVDMRIQRCVDSSESRKIPTQCLGGNCCEDCLTARAAEGRNSEWKRVEGRFLGISGANISCRCKLSPLGMAPFAHLADGHIDLILIRKASRLQHLRYLLRTAGDSRRAFALPFVERYKVDEFIFTPVQCCPNSASVDKSVKLQDVNSPDSNEMSFPVCGCDSREKTKRHSVWNCDGELWCQPSVRVTVHQNLIRVMTRSPPLSSESNHLGFATSSLSSPSSCCSSPAASSIQSTPSLSPSGNSEATIPTILTPITPGMEEGGDPLNVNLQKGHELIINEGINRNER